MIAFHLDRNYESPVTVLLSLLLLPNSGNCHITAHLLHLVYKTTLDSTLNTVISILCLPAVKCIRPFFFFSTSSRFSRSSDDDWKCIWSGSSSNGLFFTSHISDTLQSCFACLFCMFFYHVENTPAALSMCTHNTPSYQFVYVFPEQNYSILSHTSHKTNIRNKDKEAFVRTFW